MPISCAVCGCHSSGQKPNSLHRFPKDPELRKKWSEALNYEPKSHSRVCSLHFLPSDYPGFSIYTDLPHVHRTLKRDAVPSVHLRPYDVYKRIEAPPQGRYIKLMRPIRRDPLKNPKMYICTASPVARRKAAVQNAAVKSELFCSNVTNVASSTEVILGIPTEEHLIKQEPVEENSDCQAEDPLALKQEEPMVIEDVENSCHKTAEVKAWTFGSDIDGGDTSNFLSSATSEVKHETGKRAKPSPGVEKNPNKTAIVMGTSPSSGKTITICSSKNDLKKPKESNTKNYRAVLLKKPEQSNPKYHLADFSIDDMANPQLAAKFYALTTAMMDRKYLLNENRQLHIRNKMLQDEIECLKKEQYTTRCTRYKGAPEENYPEPSEESTSKQQEEPTVTVMEDNRKAAPPVPASKSKMRKFSGRYRIVDLERFVNDVCDMQRCHSGECQNARMLATAEELSGITGEWTFECTNCASTETLRTDYGRATNCRQMGGPKRWLDWLQCLGPWSYVEEMFEKMGVPFHYAISPTNLDVVTFKRRVPR